MRTLFAGTLLALLLVLFSSTAYMGGRPVISTVVRPFEQAVSLTQAFELWVDEPGRWQLSLICPHGLTLDQPLWQGNGGGYERRAVDIGVNSAALGEGLHRLKLEIIMEGAQAILGLPCAGEYWILPLNGPHVRIINARGLPLEITNEEWVLVEEGAEVFFNGSRLERPQQKALSAPSPAAAGGALRWVAEGLHLEAGEKQEVVLALTGPLPVSQLELFCGPDLAIGGSWDLGGRLLMSESLSSTQNVLKLPPLGPGDHLLRGYVRALLPREARRTSLRASLPGSEAVLAITIGRDWFDFSHLHFLQLDRAASGGDLPLLMPDGGLHYPGDGPVLARSPRLAAVVPLAAPDCPVWVGVPLGEIAPFPFQPGPAPSQFILPVLVWDPDFTWRLIAKREEWLLDLSGKHSQVLGKVGPLLLTAADGRMTVANQLNHYQDSHGWRWWKGFSRTGGAWSGATWGFTFEIPRGQKPYFSLQYAGAGVRARVSADDAVLSLERGKLNFGFRWKTKGLWVRALDQSWRLDVDRDRLKLQAAVGSSFNCSLQANFGQKWVLNVDGELTEFYVSGERLQMEEWGVRFRMPNSAGPRHALTTGAAQLRDGIALFEIAHQQGYRFSPRLAIYARATVRGMDGKVHFNCGAGLIYTPLPQLLGNLDWDWEGGWRFRAGIAIPLLRR